MLERLDRGSRAVIADARAEALAHADTSLEAEHLLLALARRAAWDAGRMLAEAGLDHERLRDALDVESARTLAAIGIPATLIEHQPASLPPGGEPRWGASAKRALHRSLLTAKSHRARAMTPTHLLLGVLGATEGTVPRTLATAGVDVGELVMRAESTLGDRPG